MSAIHKFRTNTVLIDLIYGYFIIINITIKEANMLTVFNIKLKIYKGSVILILKRKILYKIWLKYNLQYNINFYYKLNSRILYLEL